MMVSKSKDKTKKEKESTLGKQKKGRIKVLNLNKETVKDLTKKEQGGVVGGLSRPRDSDGW